MKLAIIKACSDLGVHISGSEKGPLIINKFDNIVEKNITIKKEETIKEIDKEIKLKNLNKLNEVNEELYKSIINIDEFVITLGGDHSIAIASILASKKKSKNMGLIWIDSHADFHTIETTISGNIHGMPFATVCGQNGDKLSYFFDEEYIKPENAVLVGARDIELPEYQNLETAGVKVYTTEDIKKYGVENIMKEAIQIASTNTNGFHVSYDLDVIDPSLAPGVSVKAKDGISVTIAEEILNQLLKSKEHIKSFDLVELNPEKDIDNKTLTIAETLLEKLINEIK